MAPFEAEPVSAGAGGLVGDGDTHLCNIWQGTFPMSNTKDDGHLGTAPVRSFPPNGYGLYEVSGNVWEWCSDWFLPKYYRNSPGTNPQGPTIGAGRVMRGGSYLCHESYCNPLPLGRAEFEHRRVLQRQYRLPDRGVGKPDGGGLASGLT